MREIKFRAWDLETNQWITESGTTFTGKEPTEGQIALSLNGHLRVFSSSCFDPDVDEHGRITQEAVDKQIHAVSNSEYESVHPMYTEPHYKKQYVLMQFTGLLDKNGKEIYEGDIVEWQTDSEGGNSRMVASFDFEGGQRVITSPYINSTSEVIGNIYENKELLK